MGNFKKTKKQKMLKISNHACCSNSLPKLESDIHSHEESGVRDTLATFHICLKKSETHLFC